MLNFRKFSAIVLVLSVFCNKFDVLCERITGSLCFKYATINLMADTLEVIKEAKQLRDLEGKVSKAIKILEDLGEEIKEDPLLSYDYPMILKELGIYYSDLGQNEKSKEYLQQALQVAKKDLNKIEVADIRCSLAFLELNTGSVEKALGYALRAWEYIGKKRGDKFTETKANTAAVLGNIYFEQGKYSQAMKMYKKALRYAESVGHVKRVITVIGDMAEYYITVKEKLDKAQELLEEYTDKAEESCKIVLPELLMRLSSIFFKKGDLAEARATAKKALRFVESRGLLRQIAEVNELLGKIYSETNQEKADAYFKKAFDSYNKGGYNTPTEHPKEEDWFTDFN